MSAGWTPADWLAPFAHCAALSLLAVGGAVAVVPDLHRVFVLQRQWLGDADFAAAIAIAQAAPGPNLLFVALLGWQAGLAAAGWMGAGAGLLLAMAGLLLPSCTLTLLATRWLRRHADHPAVRAFKAGMAPVVVGLMLAAGWVLTAGSAPHSTDWPLWLLATATAALLLRTRIHLLWLLGGGAAVGAWMA